MTDEELDRIEREAHTLDPVAETDTLALVAEVRRLRGMQYVEVSQTAETGKVTVRVPWQEQPIEVWSTP